MALGPTIKTIQDIMRQDTSVDGDAQRIGQLAWMLFLKILDDREIENKTLRERSPIPDALRWQSWAATGGLTGDELLRFIDTKLFPGLQDLPDMDPFERVVRQIFMDDVFADPDNRMKSGALLRQVIDKLNEIDFSSAANRHEVVESFEQILGDLHGAGTAGEHYTPRAVIQFMVEQVDPRLGETVLDPACGTGGFLARTIDHVRSKHKKTDDDEPTIAASIRGIETKQLPHLLCVINMILHGIEAPTEIHLGTALGIHLRDHVSKQPPDVILTTPPFGGMEERGIEKAFPAAFRTRETADLFLYRIITLLRPGGRAAIVVPDGLLFEEGMRRTRLKEKLLEECNLHTIVRLPNGVFTPYTMIKSNLLFFTKGEPTKEIWYYDHSYSRENQYSKTRPLRVEEFAPERAWWHDRKETRQAWKVSIDEIKARGYNLDLRWLAADTGQAPSRLASLTLQGFRGFGKLDLTLPREGPAVLIGVNGAGKSTVLEGIAILLSSFTAAVSGTTPREAEFQLRESDIRTGDEGATVSATFRIGEELKSWERYALRANRALDLDSRITEQAEALRDQLLRFGGASVPVLCFYPASRGLGDNGGDKRSPQRGRSNQLALLIEDGDDKRSRQPFPQLEVYDRSFQGGLGPFNDFIRWFRLEEDLENQLRLREDPSLRSWHLEIVRKALQRFLGELGAARFANPRIERSSDDKEATLVLEKDGEPLRIDQLSEGEKNTILLVSDIARRLAIANPARTDPLQGEGIVLIDEIDLHLHPGWQRGLLPALCVTFPGCQFIVSTHSPQVLSRMTKEHVFILENFELVRMTPHTYGRDANSILGEAMGLPERPADIEAKIRQASILVDDERLEEAKVALDELVSLLGDDDNVIVRLRTLVSFLEDES